MIDSLFFLLMGVAVVAYGVQGSLQTTFARAYDGLTVGVYRNLSLIVTMAPLLLFVPAQDFTLIHSNLSILFFASLSGSLSLWCALTASRYLPIGISTALRQVMHISVAFTLGFLFLGEILTPAQAVLLISIALTGIALTLVRRDDAHLDPRAMSVGIIYTLLAGLLVAVSFFFFTMLARQMHPFLVGYMWEAGVGACLVILYCLRKNIVKEQIKTIPFNHGARIVLISLLTIIGTTAYGFAVQHGPYALASGLLSMNALVASIMGWILYHERLSRFQIILIVCAVGLMILLKVLS